MSYRIAAARTRSLAVLAVSAALLAGCGSKPEAGDIAKQLTASLQCRPLTISDVKKVNGAEGQNGTYEVAYTFKAEIKGGKSAAAELLSKWAAINEKVAYLEKNRWTIGPHEAMQQTAPLKQQAADLFGCDSLEGYGFMERIMHAGKENLAKGDGPVPVPVALDLQGAGLMKKTEAGWVFVQAMPHQLTNVVLSEPVKVDRPAAMVPPGAATSATAKTLTGLLKIGNLDSCLETKTEAGEKCYAFVTDTADGKAILTQCRDGERCAVTAAFDDAKEQLSQVSAAQKSN